MRLESDLMSLLIARHSEPPKDPELPISELGISWQLRPCRIPSDIIETLPEAASISVVTEPLPNSIKHTQSTPQARGSQRINYGLLQPDELASLSPRQQQVLRLKSQGMRNKEVAQNLGISEKNVGFQASSGISKLRKKRPTSQIFANTSTIDPGKSEVKITDQTTSTIQQEPPRESTHNHQTIEVTIPITTNTTDSSITNESPTTTNPEPEPAWADVQEREALEKTASAIESGNRSEHQQFAGIFESYQERIFNCVYRYMGNKQEAEELAQETFLRAYAGLAKVDGELKIGPWLYRIATNLCMDKLRRRKLVRWEPWQNAETTTPADGRTAPLVHPKLVANDNPESDVMRQAERELVHETLQDLPPRYRIALVLREYDGMSCEEIASVIGSSRSAVKSLLFRARQEFRGAYLRKENAPIR